MKRVQLLVLERDVRAVTLELGRLGILHITSSQDTNGLVLPSAQKTEQALGNCDAALARLRAAAAALRVEEARAGSAAGGSMDEVAALLARLEPRLGEIESQTAKLREEISEKRRLLGEIRRYETLTVPFAELSHAGFLHFAVGSIPVREMPTVVDETLSRAVLVPFAEEEGRRHVIAVSSRKGKWSLQGVLEKHDFRPESLEGKTAVAPRALIEAAQAQLADLDRKLAQAEEEKTRLREEEGKTLSELLGKLELERKILSAQRDFAHTWSATLITGWVLEARVDELIDAVAAVTGNRVVIEFRDPSDLPDETVPTLLSHRRFFRPFEMFVTAFGVPGYQEAEPTVPVALSFLLMFGFMFGDVGQGAVLLLAGLALAFLGRTPRARDIGVIVASAGGAAAAFGVLYGSVFGADDLIPPLWMNPLRKLAKGAGGDAFYAFFGTAILIGFLLINLGLAFNLMNRLRRRDWVHAFLDKFGLVGIVFYWGMVALGMRRLLTGRLDLWTLIVFVGIPLLVIMFQEPVRLVLSGRARARAPHETGAGLALFLGLVEGLETVLGYLSNTLSFVRVAAFALSHAALCLAVFSLAEVLAPSAGPTSPGRIAILVLGNAFIIALEGLIAAIQTMRLEYYEFFSKFFVGEGKPYRPFTLDSNARTYRSPMERSTPR